MLVVLIKFTKIQTFTLQYRIIWEPQDVKKLTTNVNKTEYLDVHCKEIFLVHVAAKGGYILFKWAWFHVSKHAMYIVLYAP